MAINRNWPWPTNVGRLGTFTEEVSQQQRLEKNPEASPLAEARPSELLNPSRTSEHLRVGNPLNPKIAEGEASQLVLIHVVLRRLLMKRKKRSWSLFDDAVEDEPLDGLPDDRREQLRARLRRERAMLMKLDDYTELAEVVYLRLLSESKG